MPEPAPVMILATLAIGMEWQGKCFGREFIRTRNPNLADSLECWIRGILVQAIDGNAAAFYSHYGFLPAPLDSLVMAFPPDRMRK